MTADVEATAIVLCGGRTTRFGGDKARASVGGRPVMDRVIDVVGEICTGVIAVTSHDRPDLHLPPGVRVVADIRPGRGPLAGICTGLRHTPTDLALVVGCDMPFLNPRVLGLMLDRLTWFDAVVPRHGDGYLEPLHAVYARGCLPRMEAHLASGRLALWDVLQQLNTRYLEEAECRPLDPELLSFFNLNSPADLRRAERVAVELDGSADRD